MGDRENRAELPIIPGQVYVEVDYDYEYKTKDRQIVIRQGERYILVKKSNEDWWQVRKDEATKCFYVPAQYVREVRKALMPPPKPLHHGGSRKAKPSALELHRSNENLSRSPEAPGVGRLSNSPSGASIHLTPPSPHGDANQNPSSPTGHGKGLAEPLLNNNNDHQTVHHGSNTLPRTRAASPTLRAPEHRSPALGRRQPLDIDMELPCDSPGEGSEKRNDSESGDDLSSSSTEHLQNASHTGPGFPETLVHTNLKDLKITQSSQPPQPSSSPLLVLGDWEMHKDSSGRPFYYNCSTQERTWKPPRARDASKGEAQGNVEPEWLKHADGQGRPYYYSADGSRSEWELPKYDQSAPQPVGHNPKSRSLDRKHIEPNVLNKWRNSTSFMDANDKDSSFGQKVPGSPDSDSSSPTSPKPPTSPSEKCGVLNVTKVTEQGKKVRKNWTSSWTVLQGSSLLFTKPQGGGTHWFGGSQSKPEFTVDLRGASVDWASKEKSSKKHVIEVKTRQGTEFLIQSDTDSVVSDWYRALLEAISTHNGNDKPHRRDISRKIWECDDAFEEEIIESTGTEKQEKEKEHRDSKKGRGQDTPILTSLSLKNSSSMDSSDQKKTKTKLKKFLTRRPTLQAVKDKGYIKDQVFGCSLSSLCHRESLSVPSFVRVCIDHVENTGLSVDGLYRVSGNLAVIQKLRFAVNHDEKVNLEDPKWEDIHVTTGALKMFFRELPEPLFTYGSFQDFVTAIKIHDYKQRVQAIKDLIRHLPQPNQETMQVLFKHLRKVIDHGEENRMTTQSVAIVFGPTLLRPETESLNMAVHMVYQNQIVELILMEYEGIFNR